MNAQESAVDDCDITAADLEALSDDIAKHFDLGDVPEVAERILRLPAGQQAAVTAWVMLRAMGMMHPTGMALYSSLVRRAL